MQRSTLLMLAMLAVLGVAGYLERDFLLTQFDKVKARFFGGRDTAFVSSTPGDTTTTDAVSAPPEIPTPRPAAPQYPTGGRPLRDEPLVSNDTGTIDPRMTERDVYSLWGPPVGVRRAGEWTYLYFRNGCEYSCGTYDVVFLHNGAVVDAVLRWPGHGYSGQSSSPPGVVPLPTKPGDTLVVAPPAPNN
jgi:hypothetical protein